MLRFFSKMRYKLAAENRVAKYMRYAVGEILLVVIGILIALQINNWNSNRIDQLKEREYLEHFLGEMQSDSVFLNVYWTKDYPEKEKGLELARKYAKYGVEIDDTATFFSSIGKGGKLSRAAVFEESSTYKDIISTGNLKLISNKDLQLQIIQYYTAISTTITYMDNLRSEYATFVNSMIPYNPQEQYQPDRKDYERALQKMKSDEFLSLANQELTFAYSLNRRMERVNTRLVPLIELIEAELRNTER
ncbi:hypothetical protein SLH46_01750 [Draconibacterium sp. IB214405]|uniref:hypothetical protein n=1 Tax=Draconibacterium sp. IB214405 TaxID=3097352 RepID=UPI002A175E3D|nr:hypothetical protein [Draconibacterium sp. IB214405]MDX8337887.1 hypothetical protein [Draconibacterium sp. IB214405]